MLWTGVVASIFAFSAAPAATFEELRELEKNLCAVSALEAHAFSKAPTHSDSRRLEADGGCIECDIKQAVGPSKLGEVEGHIAVLSRPIMQALQRDQERRDLAFFKYLAKLPDKALGKNLGESIKPNQESVEQMNVELAKAKSQLSEAQTKFDQRYAFYQIAKKVESALRSLRTGKGNVSHPSASLSTDERTTFFKSFHQEHEAVVSTLRGRIADYESKVRAAEESSNADQAKVYMNYVVMYEGQIEEAKKKFEAIRGLESALMPGSKKPLRASDAETLNLWVEGKVSDSESSAQAQEEEIRKIKNKIFSFEKKIGWMQSKGAKDLSGEAKDLAEFEAQYSAFVNTSVFGEGAGLPCGLSVAEAYAIRLYTRSGFLDLNTALRKGGAARESVKPFEDVLNAALSKLRAYDGQVVRSGNLPPDVLAQHQEGAVVSYSAFTSASVGTGFNGAHRFVILPKEKGHYIGPLSANVEEQEVLFRSGTRFKILKRTGTGAGVDFDLEEVTDEP